MFATRLQDSFKEKFTHNRDEEESLVYAVQKVVYVYSQTPF